MKLKQIIAVVMALVMCVGMTACFGKNQSAVSSVVTESEISETNDTSSTVSKNPTVTSNSTACNHKFKGATCTEASVCTVCGQIKGSALGHKYNNATCTEVSVCSVCGKQNGSTIGHKFSSATCKEPKKCSVCGKTEGNALGHNMQNGSCTRCGVKDEKTAQITYAKIAYQKLNEATTEVNKLMDSIYNAWYFAIYRADGYSDGSRCWAEFSVDCYLDDYELALDITLDAMDYYGVDNYIDALSDFNITLYIIEEYFKQTNGYDKATNLVNEAKEALKNVTAESENQTGYATLKNYYTEVATYLEFIKKVTGSFNQLNTRIENFESISVKYKNELSIKLG